MAAVVPEDLTFLGVVEAGVGEGFADAGEGVESVSDFCGGGI